MKKVNDEDMSLFYATLESRNRLLAAASEEETGQWVVKAMPGMDDSWESYVYS